MSLKLVSPTYYARISTARDHIKDAKRLLDIGCSDGFMHTQVKAKNIIGIDINESDLRLAKLINPKNKYLKENVYSLSFKDGEFDHVVCLDVLEHLDDDLCAIKEMSRVLKKKGRLIITVPSKNYPFFFDPINYVLRSFNLHLPIGIWGFGHVRLYDFKDLESKLKKASLKIIKRKQLSHAAIGIVENGYLINLIQPLVKSSPRNQDDEAKDFEKLKIRMTRKPSRFLIRLRDKLLAIDDLFFKRSKTSINLFVVAEKIK